MNPSNGGVLFTLSMACSKYICYVYITVNSDYVDI